MRLRKTRMSRYVEETHSIFSISFQTSRMMKKKTLLMANHLAATGTIMLNVQCSCLDTFEEKSINWPICHFETKIAPKSRTQWLGRLIDENGKTSMMPSMKENRNDLLHSMTLWPASDCFGYMCRLVNNNNNQFAVSTICANVTICLCVGSFVHFVPLDKK